MEFWRKVEKKYGDKLRERRKVQDDIPLICARASGCTPLMCQEDLADLSK